MLRPHEGGLAAGRTLIPGKANMTFNKIGLLSVLMAAVALAAGPVTGYGANRPEASDYNVSPPYLAGAAPPLVMLVLARDQSLFHLAYNDTSDIDGDGKLDIGFNPSISYYGLFDSATCYKPGTAGGVAAFVPSRVTTTGGSFGSNPKKPAQQEVDPGPLGYCGGNDEWSGNFLNYVTTNRMDALRKVFYGGKRVVDTASVTVLEAAAAMTTDAHAWGKEIYSDEDWPDYSPYYDIRKYAPLDKPRNSVTKYSGFNKPRNNPAKHFLGVYSYGRESDRNGPILGVLKQQEVQPTPAYGDPSAVPTEPQIFNWLLSEAPLPRPAGELQRDTNGGNASPIEYMIRAQVCVNGLLESNCKAYPQGSNKPIGILQRYGDDKQMFFGLITGSYAKNHSGGILRKNISSMHDEINIQGNGTFISGAAGIIKTIDSIQISGWNNYRTQYLQDSADQCGYLAFRSPVEGECRSWGNPIGEMMYEAVRYFNVRGGPTTAFSSSGSSHAVEKLLPAPAWKNPYEQVELNNYENCVQPYIMVISDVNISFDSDQVPGSKFGNLTDNTTYARVQGEVKEAMNVANLLGVITENEKLYEDSQGQPAKFFIGQTTSSNYDTTCTAKVLSKGDNGLANVRGLCPGEPTRQGSYSAAAVAYFANTHLMYSGTSPSGEKVDVPNATTFAVALASPLPTIEIPVKGRTITLVPYGKTYYGHLAATNATITNYGSFATKEINSSPPPAGFQPTNTIVNMFIKQWDTDDDGSPFAGAFDINFEFLEQGGNYDMDAIVRYTFALIRSSCPGTSAQCAERKVVDTYGHIGNKNATYYKVADKSEMKANDIVGVWLHLRSYYAASYGQQNLGYIISGTTADGPYLVVSDYDTAKAKGRPYHLNRPDVCTSFDDTSTACRGSNRAGVTFYGGSNSPWLESARFFKPNIANNGSAAQTLPNPLWLAAKYGGFKDLDGNSLPDNPKQGRPSEWDSDNNGDPDTYFFVVNPSKMEEQINKAFSAILQQAAQGAAGGISNNTTSGEGGAYRPLFYPLQSAGDYNLRWGGYLQALFIDKNGFYRENTHQVSGGPPILDKDDLIVTFESGRTDGSVSIRFWRDPDFTGLLNNEVTSRQTSNFNEIKYIWEAGSLLSGASAGASPSLTTTATRDFTSTDPQKRFLFTYADLNNDGAVTGSPATPGSSSEVMMFDSGNSSARSALGRYLRASAVKTVGSGDKQVMFMARQEGPGGGSVSVAIQNAGGIVGNVDVSASGNVVTIKKKSNSVTAKEVVDAVNQHSAASLLVRALLPAGDTDGSWALPVSGVSSLSYDEGVRLLMSYATGNEVPNWRSRMFQINGKKVVWRFGDPMNSSPLAVGAPASGFDNTYGDTSYKAFAQANKNRRSVVFIGTNDGFLRAINAGFMSSADGQVTYLTKMAAETAWPLGMEIWGYVPQAVLPHLRWLTEDSNFHTYMVDLTPRVVDVKISGEWRTLLIGGLRLGGKGIDVSEAFSSDQKIIRSEIFAIDITDPETKPKLLWNYTSSRLGMTTSRPSWIRADNDWYIVLGSGPSSDSSAAYDGLSIQKGQIILLNAATGAVRKTWNLAEEGSFLSEPAVIKATDKIVNTATQTVSWINPLTFFGLTYQGDTYRISRGGVYQLCAKGSSNPDAWSATPVVTGLGAVSAAPAAFFSCTNNLWLYFGTGRFWTKNDGSPCASRCEDLTSSSSAAAKAECTSCQKANTNYFVGIRRSGVNDETTITSPDTQLADLGGVVVSGDENSASYEDNGTTYNTESEYRAMRENQLGSGVYGYKIPLRDENEVVLNQPVTVTDSNCGCMLFFTTYVPPQKICSYAGASYLYAVDCFLGVSTSKTRKFTGSDDGIYNNRKSIGTGMPLQPTLVSTSSGLYLITEDSGGITSRERVGDATSSVGSSWSKRAWREEQRGFGEDLSAPTPQR